MLICHILRVVLAYLALVNLDLMLQLIQLIVELLESCKKRKKGQKTCESCSAWSFPDFKLEISESFAKQSWFILVCSSVRVFWSSSFWLFVFSRTFWSCWIDSTAFLALFSFSSSDFLSESSSSAMRLCCSWSCSRVAWSSTCSSADRFWPFEGFVR